MKAEVQTLPSAISHLGALRLVIASVRPQEWIKNTFLFAPLFFSQNVLNPELLAQSSLAFLHFCLASGGVYLVNDMCDRDRDKRHPQKQNRPIASGALSAGVASGAAVSLLAGALIGAFLMNVLFGWMTISYVVLNLVYSKWLKHIVILDVFSIAAGFVLRVIAGAVVIDVVMSQWLLICTTLLALFLGFGKRRSELTNLTSDAKFHRLVLAEYDPVFLDMMIGIVTSVTVVAYIFYTISLETVYRLHTDKLLLTVPFVLYGIFRFLYQIYHKNGGGDPSRTLVTDVPLLINIGLWAVVCGYFIYGASP